MKNRVFNFLIISLSIVYGCDVLPEIEAIEIEEEIFNTISIPEGFDFSIEHDKVIIKFKADNYESHS